MRRLLLIVAIALAATAGVAHGDSSKTITLPGFDQANAQGSLPLDPNWQSPPAQPVQLDYATLQQLWVNAGSAYGVPWQVLAAINKIESNFGRNMGPSSAGAIGWMQFMPSTWTSWGVDADGNGVADPWNPYDAVYAAARYLAASGAQSNISGAIFSYNHAQWYVNEVLQLAQLYGLGSGSNSSSQAQAQAQTSTPTSTPTSTQQAQPQPQPQPQKPAGPSVSSSDFGVQQQGDANTVVFTLDKLQVDLQAAQQEVAKANGLYAPARKQADDLVAQVADLQQRAETATLLSDQLSLQKEVSQLSYYRDLWVVYADKLKTRLTSAQTALATARTAAKPASFDNTAAQVLSAPAPVGHDGYVFPVGGGAGTVSVSHYHHDYPAADIAAPEGAPVYALADSTVLRSWATIDPHCGIGLTLQSADGQVWTYCHLSYLEPTVQPGVSLKAGDPVGLVGMTGHATGPHLHLQLQPASSYPQIQHWFESFAGTAFRWQDAAPNLPPASSSFAALSQVQPGS